MEIFWLICVSRFTTLAIGNYHGKLYFIEIPISYR